MVQRGASGRALAVCRRLVAGGRLAEAEARLKVLVLDDSVGVEAGVLLGIVLARAGRWDESAARLDAALEQDPSHLEALTWSAAACKAQGSLEEAITRLHRVLERRKDDPEPFNLLGSCLLAQGKAAEAEAAFRTALGLREKDAASHANLGMALRLQNRGEEALGAFRRACDLDPARATNHLQLFKQLQQLSRWREAIEALRSGLERLPGSVLLTEALAVAYGRLGRLEEAERLFQRVSEVSASAANHYAAWLQEEGRFEDAVPVLQRSLRLQPFQGEPYRILAETGRSELGGEPLLGIAVRLSGDARLDDTARMHLAFARGKLYERERDFEAALRSFDAANRAAYELYPGPRAFDLLGTEREPGRLGELYSERFLERLASSGVPDARPTFIVGMIRSGTTLLDRIVSAHPDVVSRGEGTFWNVEADALHHRWLGGDPMKEELAALAGRYLDATGIEVPQGRFTDKMPLNYRNLGLIRATFPEARIVHIRRNPLDTCLSIYSTFLGGGASFAYDQAHLVAFYRAYLRTMAHWRRVLPRDRFLELDYESLVADPEAEARRVVDFLGLPWDDACLHHETNKGGIGTPSRWQARQPVYSTSVGKGIRYEPWLGALCELKELAHPP